jgi:hypothetical protein
MKSSFSYIKKALRDLWVILWFLIDSLLIFSNKYPFASINLFIGVIFIFYLNRFENFNDSHCSFEIQYDNGYLIFEECRNSNSKMENYYGPFKTKNEAKKQIDKIEFEKDNKLKELDFLGLRHYWYSSFIPLGFFLIAFYDLFRIYSNKLKD